MITFALDTSTVRGSVALLRDDAVLAAETFERARAGDGLFDAVAGALRRAAVAPTDVELLAVGLGPGSFTGIRAGIAAARGLALPGNRPIKGVSSFDALALAALPQMPGSAAVLCVQCDARRGELYYAFYDRYGRRQGEVRIGTHESIVAGAGAGAWFVSAENGFYPDAAMVGRLARERGDERLEPLYLRAPDYRQSASSTAPRSGIILPP